MGNLPIERDWIYDWLTSDAAEYITWIIAIAASIIHPILFVLHVYRTILKSNNFDKHGIEKRIKATLKLTVNIITLMAIAFGALATMIVLINHSSVVSSSKTCQPITIMLNICWIFTKLCIYNVLIIRLIIAFWGSVYEYNRRLMLTASCFVTIICIVCIIGSFLDVDSEYFITGWCLFIIPTWLILLPCALDVICGLFALYLFTKPLKRTLNDINLANNISKRNFAVKVAQLMSKLIVLITIAVLSNICSGILFAVTDIALGSYLDTLINPICLVLMEAKHKRLYGVLCNCCDSGVQRIVFGYNQDAIQLVSTENDCDTNTTNNDTNKSEKELQQLSGDTHTNTVKI